MSVPLKDRLFVYRPGDTRGTFTRTGTATYMDVDGIIQTAADGVRRDGHFRALAGARYLLLEDARTQVAANPEAPNSWTNVGTPVITTGQTDPWGGTAAILVEDNDAGVGEGKQTTPTFTGDGEKVCVVALRSGTAASLNVQVWDSSASVIRHVVSVTWQSGNTPPTVVGGSGSGTVYPSVATYDSDGNLWWLVRFSADGVIAANNNRLRASLNAADTGTFYLAGGNAFDATFPSSWQGASLGTRNIEEFTIPYTYAPQAMTVYVNFVERERNASAVDTILNFGANAADDLRLGRNGLNYLLTADRAGGFVTSQWTPASAPSFGSGVELSGVVFEDGALQLHGATGGGSEEDATKSSALAMAGAFNSQTLYVNSADSGGQVGFTAIRAIAVAAGEHSLEDMRAFAVSPYVSFVDSTGEVMLSQLTPVLHDWVPGFNEIADREATLGDGISYQLKYRTDYLAQFTLKHLKSTEVDDAFRLKAHLLNGGTIDIVTGDYDHDVYTARLAPGSVPELSFQDPTQLEYSLSLAVKNTAAAAMVLRHE